MPTDFKAEVERLRRKRLTSRRKRWGASRLDRYGPEIRALREAGAKLAEIQIWLSERRIRVHISTIKRWLDKHGEAA